MSRSTIPELLGDLDDIIGRIRDAGLPVAALERARRSLPHASVVGRNAPVWDETRRAFRQSVELLRRVRRDP